MRILQVHNRYRSQGGEDVTARQEMRLLRSNGHHVDAFVRDNETIGDGPGALLRTALGTIWSGRSYRELRARLGSASYDVVHCHNTFPLVSPSAYYACRSAGVPVVQTLQNYRLSCPAYAFYRDGEPCEACAGRAFAWPGVMHRCYRDSAAATATVAAMQTAHRFAGTWSRLVDRYIAVTEFGRRKYVEAGLPAERVDVKPNFVTPDPGPGPHTGDYALFVGRLVPEKGVDTLLEAWRRFDGRRRLLVVGRGPLAGRVRRATGGVELLGGCPRDRVVALMREARVLVFPSEWYEGFPLTLVEAYATGLPVIASGLGAMREIVDHGRTGLHFSPGDADELAARLRWAVEHPAEMARMGRRARESYERKYTAERNHSTLTRIYRHAIERATQRA